MIFSEKPEVELFTSAEHIERKLNELQPGIHISTGSYISDVPGYLIDLEWNLYDEFHRIYVHNSYHGMYKVFSGKTFSVNTVKFGKLPIFIQVANAKVADNLFYQTMDILGVLFVHQIVALEQLDRNVRVTRRWYTASHKLFRPLHSVFNKMLLKLQHKQDVEDNVLIRGQRLKLRDRGFCFLTDRPTFTNSNRLNDHVVPPASTARISLKLEDIVEDKIHTISIGAVEILLQRNAETIKIWPGLCPHEGAAFTAEHICNDQISCPWHGRQFRPAVLGPKHRTSWTFLNVQVNFDGVTLEGHALNNKSCIERN